MYTYLCHGYLLCTAKPKDQKLDQGRHVVEDFFTASLTSASVEKTSKTRLIPRANADDDDDIFADIFSSSSKTKSNDGMSKSSSMAVANDIFAAEPAASAVKTARPTLQSKKAAVVTNAFSIEDDDVDDIFAIKPSLTSTAKSSTAATGSSTQKVFCFCC